MRKLIGALIGIGLVAIAAIVTIQWQGNSPSPAEATGPSTEIPTPTVKPRTAVASVRPYQPVEQTRIAPEPVREPTTSTEATSMPLTAQPTAARPATAVKSNFSPAFNQAFQTLLTSKGDYADKQAAWQQLHQTGKMDQAIAELERRTVEDPSDAESLAVLGQAYLNKCGHIQDMREQGILAMKSDQTLEAALKLDPKNWEARFTKTWAMSHWPPELNKSQEVMENLVILVEQQEAQSPQPQFAQTYVLLGEQYKKAGYPDLARDMWQRGARLYPNDGALPKKLAGQQ